MTLQVLQRADWYGEPQKMGDAFRLVKGARTAECEIWSHILGWELRLLIKGDELPRTHVCRSQDEVFDTFEAWKRALTEKGWTT